MNDTQHTIDELLRNSEGLGIAAFIRLLTDKFPGQVCFSSSFSFEDQAITHEILSNQLPVKIFTLDTGRIFPETYSVWSRTNEQYQTNIKAYYPNQESLSEFVTAKGPNSFYESVENRKGCCYIRKVEPLKHPLTTIKSLARLFPCIRRCAHLKMSLWIPIALVTFVVVVEQHLIQLVV